MYILFADGFGVVDMFRVIDIVRFEFSQVRYGEIVLQFLDDRTLGRELPIVFVQMPSFSHFLPVTTGGDLIGQQMALRSRDGHLLVSGLRQRLILLHRSSRDFQRTLKPTDRRTLHAELTKIGVGHG